MGGFIPPDGTAFGATVSDDEPFFGVGCGSHRLHESTAVCGAVAGIHVKMYRPKAKRAVIPRRVTKGLHLTSAVPANKGVIVFRKSFRFHATTSHRTAFIVLFRRAFVNGKYRAYPKFFIPAIFVLKFLRKCGII